jgi:L-asparaginase II
MSALECGAHWPYDDGASARWLARQGRAARRAAQQLLGQACRLRLPGCLCAARRPGPARLPAGLCRARTPGDARGGGRAGGRHRLADLAGSARGVDGCSIPTYAIPLRPLALAFARVATGQGLQPGHARAARRLRQAVAAAPQQVAGSHRFDSRLMARFGERVFCKVGAEGVYCIALPQAGLGIAIKMDDGNTARACEVVAAALIESLAGAGDEDSAFLAQWSSATLRNWNGREIGRLAAAPALRQALGHGGR